MITEYWDNEKQELNFDISDEILKGCVLTYEGEIINELITQNCFKLASQHLKSQQG